MCSCDSLARTSFVANQKKHFWLFQKKLDCRVYVGCRDLESDSGIFGPGCPEDIDEPPQRGASLIVCEANRTLIATGHVVLSENCDGYE